MFLNTFGNFFQFRVDPVPFKYTMGKFAGGFVLYLSIDVDRMIPHSY